MLYEFKINCSKATYNYMYEKTSGGKTFTTKTSLDTCKYKDQMQIYSLKIYIIDKDGLKGHNIYKIKYFYLNRIRF